MTRPIDWSPVASTDVEYALGEFDRLGPADFYRTSGFGPTIRYDLHSQGRLYPPKAILGVAYQHATGEQLKAGDFEGGQSGAVKVLAQLGFDIRPKG